MAPKAKTPTKGGAKAKAAAKSAEKTAQAARKQKAAAEANTLLEKESLAQQSSKRGRADEDHRAACLKIMNDHFLTLSDDDKYVRQIDGYTLEQRIDVDRKRWLNYEMTMGKNYYDALRTQYSTEEVPWKRIRVHSEADSDDEDLEEALFQAAKHVADYEPLALWLEQEKLPNQKNAAGLMKRVLMWDPRAAAGKNEILMKICSWCQKVSFEERYPALWQLAEAFFHIVLDKSYTIAKADGLSVKGWWSCVKEASSLLLDVDAFDKCVKCDKNWNNVRDELEKVRGSDVAKRIFAKGLATIDARQFGNFIDEAMGQLAASDTKVDKAVYKRLKDDLEGKFKQNAQSMYVAQKPRPVSVSYRAVTFMVLVKSFLDEFQVKFWALVLGAAVKQNVLSALFCESELVDVTEPARAPPIDPELIAPAVASRAEAKTFVKGPEKAGKVDIKTALVNNDRALCRMHEGWKVYMNFWLSQCGSAGEERVVSEVVGLLATPTEDRKLKACKDGIQRLIKSKLYQFIGTTLQTEMATVSGWITSMHAGRCPALPKTVVKDSFYETVVNQLPNFCREPKPEGGGEVVGRDALQLLYAATESVGGDVASAKLKPFAAYNWLLTQGEKKKVQDWTSAANKKETGKDVVASKGGGGGGAAAAASSKGVPASSKKKPTDEAILRASTKALFKN